MTQKEMIMDYLSKHKEMTPANAWDCYGITKLATVVSDLIHKDGETIYKSNRTRRNRFGKMCTFKVYSLEPFEESEVEND